MRKHEIWNVEVEPMTCRRERSYKPLSMFMTKKLDGKETTEMLNNITLTNIDTLNKEKLSMTCYRYYR